MCYIIMYSEFLAHNDDKEKTLFKSLFHSKFTALQTIINASYSTTQVLEYSMPLDSAIFRSKWWMVEHIYSAAHLP